MISKIPGWLNYILLSGFYYVLLLGLKWLSKLRADNFYLIIVALFFAGAYLAKFREQQGGGWRFW